MLDFGRERIEDAFQAAERHVHGRERFGNPAADLVARGRVHGREHAAGNAPRRVNAFAADQLDDALPELAQADAAARELEIVFEQAEEIAFLGRGIHAEQQVGRREVEETQGVGLQQLGVVHQAALEHGGARHLHSEDGVAGLGACQHVAHRADAADARHEAGHFVERAPLADLFEAPELGDVELGRFHRARIVQIDGDLGVPFDAGHGMNHDAFGHLSKPPLRRRRAAFQQAHDKFVNRFRRRRAAR